jgi:hypothetical protein
MLKYLTSPLLQTIFAKLLVFLTEFNDVYLLLNHQELSIIKRALTLEDGEGGSHGAI